MSPFPYINIVPSHGQHKAVLTWQVHPYLEGGTFYVYRSMDGATGWELLNDDGTTDQTFVDDTLYPKNLLDIVHYRLVCENNGNEYESAIKGIYNGLTRKEYAMCSKIMKMEYVQLSRADGIKVLVYKPKTHGELSDQIDPDTGQRTKNECGDPIVSTPLNVLVNNTDVGLNDNSANFIYNDANATPVYAPGEDPNVDNNSYDQKYKGGYNKPILTLVRFTDIGPLTVIDAEDGLVTRDNNTVQARFLGYPHIYPGDLIVNPETDERYAVTETVKPYKFKGVYPVAFDAKLELIFFRDSRYKVPIPDNIPKLTPVDPYERTSIS